MNEHSKDSGSTPDDRRAEPSAAAPNQPPPSDGNNGSADNNSSAGKNGPADNYGLSRLETMLPRFSLDRRVGVLVLMLTLFVLGAVATVSIPTELIPSGYTEPFLRVVAPWRDAPPPEVLDKVVLPLEEELATVSGLDDMFSFARSGFGQIFLSFKGNTDMDVAYREVRDRIERARPRLPEDLEQVMVRKDDDTSIPIAMIGLAVEEGLTDVYDLIQNEVVLPIERIEGVAAVEVNGLEEKEILIEIDRQRAESAGLNIWKVAQDLSNDNFTLASGSVRAGDKKLLLRSVARFRQPDSVGEVMVSPTVRLADIATIRYEEPEKEYSVRVNSRPAFAVMVAKEGEANTLEVADRISAVLERLRLNPRLRSMQIDFIMDQGQIIRQSLSTLLDSGRIGALFAVVVLFFFLRRFRMSLIIALSIPLSMLVALVAMYFAGESLNVLSLLGLMISVGLLVDNSVVVAENIHRIFREEGCSRREAAIRGSGEIALAITTATLTTIVVFLPVSLVEGQGQFFLLRLAIPISVSLAASLFVALAIVPLGVFLTLPERQSRRSARRKVAAAANGGVGGANEVPAGDDRRRLDGLHQAINNRLRWLYEQSFGRLSTLYQVSLRYFLRRRVDLLLALAAIFVLTQVVSKGRVDVVPMSEDDRSFFEIQVDMPNNVTFQETQTWFRSAEEVLARTTADLGLQYYILFHQRNWGQIQGVVDSKSERRVKPREIVERIMAELPEMPGAKLTTGMASESDDQEELATETLRLYGDEAVELEATAVELERVIESLPGVLGIKRSSTRQPNELALVLDRELVQKQQIDPRVIAGMVGYALRGQALPRVYFGGRDIPVRVRFEEADRSSLADLQAFAVPKEGGEAVRLASIADVERLPAATTIFRRNKQTARRITIELEAGKESAARDAIYSRLANYDLPEGLSFGERAARGRDSEDAKNLAFAAILSIVFVYLLMGFLFESFMLPLSILLTIPLANLGVTWIHLLAGRDMDFLGLVGVIILIGVVVNNGIVLLDYANRLRVDGMERTAALLLATERRFRPIFMTALTTICGMVPLTFGAPMSMGLSYKSFGLTLIGGMMTSSLLTLLVVPVFYTLFEDARSAMGRALLGALGRRRANSSAETLAAASRQAVP